MKRDCPTKGKHGWPTKFAAEQALAQIWRKGFKKGPGRLPVRAYKCDCGDWHLTSKGQR
jgi:hypothetical protein